MVPWGSKQVPVKGMDDKRQITLLLVFSKSGSVPPPQVIYAGLTDQCHPKYTFPEGWDIFHSPSHWSTEETMLRYVENVIVPYIDHVREEDDLPLRQRALCIFDVYKAHRGQSLLDLLDRNGIKAVFVPGACTDRVQPLDPIPNNLFKSYLKTEFLSFYGDEIQKQLAAGTDLSDIKIDLRTSVVKPLHAQ
ncbi:uncharacterized protein LOC132728775, partial [Ruditapes philippinarum]|uniref:uncharacterized protein LOC132728775 n=1 Tax=Ruditapes philippinarum TaxID=129788 RepID=UPI00295AB2E4